MKGKGREERKEGRTCTSDFFQIIVTGHDEEEDHVVTDVVGLARKIFLEPGDKLTA